MVPVLSRRLVLLAAVALIASGCGGGEGENSAPTTLADGVLAPTVPGETTTTSGRASDGRSSSTTRKAGERPSGGGGDGSRDDDLIRVAREGPGAFAGMLLADGPADSLVLDVLVEQGVQADSSVIAAVRQILTSESEKPVAVRGPIAFEKSGDLHSADEVRAVANDHGRSQGNGAAVVHVVYLGGSFTDDGALGVAVRGDTFAVFPDQMARVASPLVSRGRIERAVVTHELGHLLGLVDLYLNTGRDDPEHPGHSTNSRSVMFWAVESDLVGQVLGGPPPVDFDAADRADLEKIHDGARPG